MKKTDLIKTDIERIRCGRLWHGEFRSGSINVRVSEEGEIFVRVLVDRDWIRVSPTEFSSHTETINYWIDTSKLRPRKSHQGTIYVTFWKGTKTIPVTVYVRSRVGERIVVTLLRLVLFLLPLVLAAGAIHRHWDRIRAFVRSIFG
jgi:hypothetical protein